MKMILRTIGFVVVILLLSCSVYADSPGRWNKKTNQLDVKKIARGEHKTVLSWHKLNKKIQRQKRQVKRRIKN